MAFFKFFTSSILSSTIILFLISCSNFEDFDELIIDETSLIQKIELAPKKTVEISKLPNTAKIYIDQDLDHSYVESVQFAKGLGFKVSLFTDNESFAESKSEVFFSIKGKFLKDTNKIRSLKRHKCFEFVFPIDFIMPDETSITLKNRADWKLIKEWYRANPSFKIHPTIIFPMDIYLKDGTIQTLLDRNELTSVKDACKLNKDKKKCFVFQLPVTFTMPDLTSIVVSSREDFILIRKWYIENPTNSEKAKLNYPVNIVYQNGSSKQVTDEAELIAIKISCEN